MGQALDGDQVTLGVAPIRTKAHRPPSQALADLARIMANNVRTRCISKAGRQRRNGREVVEIPMEIEGPEILAMLEKQGMRCALSGLRFDTERSSDHERSPFRLSVDRIDSARGYVEGERPRRRQRCQLRAKRLG